MQNDRLAFNHGQLAAALDCLARAMVLDGKATITPDQVAEGHRLIGEMCLAQHGALGADHAHVIQFWESFDFLDAKMTEGKLETEAAGLNHHRKRDSLIAVSMPEVEQAFASHRLTIPGGSMLELKKLLKKSKARKFITETVVNARDGKHRYCWVFAQPQSRQKEALPI